MVVECCCDHHTIPKGKSILSCNFNCLIQGLNIQVADNKFLFQKRNYFFDIINREFEFLK